MKAAVLKTFRDKHTGAVYAPGEVLTLGRERFGEIRETLGNSYIAEIVDPESDPEPEKPDSGGASGSEGGAPGVPAGLDDVAKPILTVGPVLSGLTIGNLALNPTFDPSVISYTATTSNNTNKVRAVPADSGAVILISINGESVPNDSAVAWNSGENVLTVSVAAAEDGRLTEYTVVVTKE